MKANLPSGYEIRRGMIADFPAVMAIEEAAGTLFDGLSLLPEGSNEPGLITHEFLGARLDDDLLWVLTYKNEPVGFAVAWIFNGDFYVAELGVHPRHGRKGLGRKLMQAICDDGFTKGYPRITLNTFRDVRWNAPFYASMGFTIIDEKDWVPWMVPFAKQLECEGLDLAKRCFMALYPGS